MTQTPYVNRILSHLRVTGHALAPSQIRKAVDHTARPYRIHAALRELEQKGLVSSKQSGNGFRWWAVDKDKNE